MLEGIRTACTVPWPCRDAFRRPPKDSKTGPKFLQACWPKLVLSSNKRPSAITTLQVSIRSVDTLQPLPAGRSAEASIAYCQESQNPTRSRPFSPQHHSDSGGQCGGNCAADQPEALSKILPQKTTAAESELRVQCSLALCEQMTCYQLWTAAGPNFECQGVAVGAGALAHSLGVVLWPGPCKLSQASDNASVPPRGLRRP